MKKFLFALALGLLLVAALATAAAADNGPHGSFSANTDACASCHRAHTAAYGSNALLIMEPDALCLSCHNGAGAGTNVVDGVYNQGLVGTGVTNVTYAGADAYYGGGTVEGTDGFSLFGGGFTNAMMATTWNGSYTTGVAADDATSRATTSRHNYDGVTAGTVWGSGAANSVADAYALECVSCHTPHGTAGWNIVTNTPVASYRLLRWQPTGSNGFTAPVGPVNWSGGAFPVNAGGTPGWLVPDSVAAIGDEWYTIGTANDFALGDYMANSATSVRGGPASVYNPSTSVAGTPDYRIAATNLAFFCAQCHDRYFANSRLRNNTDYSAYCYGAATMPSTFAAATPIPDPYNGIAAPVSLASVSTIDAAYCVATVSTTGVGGFIWADNRPSGDGDYEYMHSSGDIRPSNDLTNAGTVIDVTTGASMNSASVGRTCVACHVAHGSSANMTAFASDATMAAVAPAAGDPGADINNSVLLRMDNRAVCLRCHASDVNFTVAP